MLVRVARDTCATCIISKVLRRNSSFRSRTGKTVPGCLAIHELLRHAGHRVGRKRGKPVYWFAAPHFVPQGEESCNPRKESHVSKAVVFVTADWTLELYPSVVRYVDVAMALYSYDCPFQMPYIVCRSWSVIALVHLTSRQIAQKGRLQKATDCRCRGVN